MSAQQQHAARKDRVRRVLSLVLGSRNDAYMGNSRWRLQTALNYVAKQADELGRIEDVEVLVTDWGSEIPLLEVLRLSPAAARIVSFLVIPPGLARELQKDSPFPEVLALNAGARRASGEYIGRIDQDTLVGGRFLETFFELYEGQRHLEVPLASALLFSGHRDIPYRLAVRCPSPWIIDRFIERRGSALPVTGADTPSPFHLKAVGIWLMHRSLWEVCGGYDERMIHMNGMEANMMHRLMKKYPMVDLGSIVGHDFYHLEHYHPWALRKPSTHRKVNAHLPFWEPDRMNPNGEGWGLAALPLAAAAPSVRQGSVPSSATPSAMREVRFLFQMTVIGPQEMLDAVVKTAGVWWNRIGTAWRTVKGRPLPSWPRLLRELWAARRAARRDTLTRQCGPRR
jgi:hypothetical protein